VLTIQGANTIDKVTLYNTLGQQVLEVRPNIETANINVEQLQSGVYMVNTVINGEISTAKFIKK
jgi:hypothetical protein